VILSLSLFLSPSLTFFTGQRERKREIDRLIAREREKEKEM
jgi:hypothetical protein